MKLILRAILFTVLLFSLVACGGSAQQAPADASNDAGDASADVTTTAPPTSTSIGGSNFRIVTRLLLGDPNNPSPRLFTMIARTKSIEALITALDGSVAVPLFKIADVNNLLAHPNLITVGGSEGQNQLMVLWNNDTSLAFAAYDPSGTSQTNGLTGLSIADIHPYGYNAGLLFDENSIVLLYQKVSNGASEVRFTSFSSTPPPMVTKTVFTSQPGLGAYNYGVAPVGDAGGFITAQVTGGGKLDAACYDAQFNETGRYAQSGIYLPGASDPVALRVVGRIGRDAVVIVSLVSPKETIAARLDKSCKLVGGSTVTLVTSRVIDSLNAAMWSDGSFVIGYENQIDQFNADGTSTGVLPDFPPAGHLLVKNSFSLVPLPGGGLIVVWFKGSSLYQQQVIAP